MEFSNNLIDLSALIVAFTALLIYFGKIIEYTKVEKFEKTDLIISGLYFSLIYLLFPIALTIFFFQKEWIINISSWAIVLIHLIIMGIYTQYNIYKNIKKYELESEVDNRLDKKIEEIRQKKSILNFFITQKPDLYNQSRRLSDMLSDVIFSFFDNSKVLLFFSIAIFYSMAITINNANILSITTITILSFVNLSMIATAYGMSTAYYPSSKITLTDDKVIEGKTIKFGDFIYIVKKDKKYIINKDQAKIIEQDLMKKNGKK